MPPTYEELHKRTADFGQQHLFHYWDELSADQRTTLLGDIARIDFATVKRLVDTDPSAAAFNAAGGKIEAPEVFPADPGDALAQRYRSAIERGESLIAESKVAAMVVAGGQGTRLGFDAPKGTFPIGPISGKSLFQLFAETIRATQRRYGCRLPWYVMTSEATDAATRAYFAEHDYLGLDPQDVTFFQQGVMPAVDASGRILLAEKHRVALSPNGHGGSLAALRDNGILDDMARRNVTAVSYWQVDNPLVSPADPLLLGLHALENSQFSSVAVSKADDLEKVGNFAVVDGKLTVIEYSDLPDELAHARNPDGTRMLDAGNIAIHVFDPKFVAELTNTGGLEMPWHIANKKVSHIDLGSGQPVEPDAPNARKFEMFIFDAIPLATRAMILEQPRRKVFSPVKNATGVDSAETARRDMVLRALDWLKQCGVALPPMADGQPNVTVEISPLRALDVTQLRASLKDIPPIKAGDKVFLQ